MKSLSKFIVRDEISTQDYKLRNGAEASYLIEEMGDGMIEISLVLSDANGQVKVKFDEQAIHADGVSAESLVGDMEKDIDMVLEYFGGDYDGGRFALEFHFYQEITPKKKHKVSFYSEVQLDQTMENRFFYPVWQIKK